MLFHTTKLPAEIRIHHLNARINEQRKKLLKQQAQNLSCFNWRNNYPKEARAHEKPIKKFMYWILKAIHLPRRLSTYAKKLL